MPLNWPVDCTTPRRRVEFCYCAQEKLRKLHNFMHAWRTSGKTEAQWDNLPTKVKNRYPYSEFLTDAQMADFRDTIFTIIEKKVIAKLLVNRQFLLDSIEWTPDLDEIHDD